MTADPVKAAAERSEAANVVFEHHRAALFPHLAVLLHTFGPDLLRNIVAGAVEAVIIAEQRQKATTASPFGEEGR